MSEPTQADREKARAVWEQLWYSYNHNVSRAGWDACIDAIAQALAEAREEGPLPVGKQAIVTPQFQYQPETEFGAKLRKVCTVKSDEG